MKRCLQFLVWTAAAMAVGTLLRAQSVPELNYDANTDTLTLPALRRSGRRRDEFERADLRATRGPGMLWRRSATSGRSITAAHACFSSIRAGKFVSEIGQGTYGMTFAQQLRVDPQDNVWVVDSGSNILTKFDTEGRFLMVLGRKPESIGVRPGPGVPARPIDLPAAPPAAAAPAAAAGGGGRGGAARSAARVRHLERGLQPAVGRHV